MRATKKKKYYQFGFDGKRAVAAAENASEMEANEMALERDGSTAEAAEGDDRKAFARKCDAQDMIDIQSFSKCNLIFNHFSSFRIFFP